MNRFVFPAVFVLVSVCASTLVTSVLVTPALAAPAPIPLSKTSTHMPIGIGTQAKMGIQTDMKTQMKRRLQTRAETQMQLQTETQMQTEVEKHMQQAVAHLEKAISPLSESDIEKLKHSLPKQNAIDRVMAESMEAIQNAIKQYQLPADLAERANQDTRFPMVSELTLGHVDTQPVNQLAHVPAFYVIGDDAFSIEWFSKHKSFLENLHAIGLVTNMDSKAQFENLQTELGVSLHPANLTNIDLYLPVQHYPFWFANGTIGQ